MTPAQERYRAYLRTPHWQVKRVRILARAAGHCEWCHRFAGPNPHAGLDYCGLPDCDWCRAYFDDDGHPNDLERMTLEVHHATYARLGAERDEDLAALCWSCHEGVTERAQFLRGLYQQGLIAKEDSTPEAAATRFWRTAWNAIWRRQ